MFRCRAREPLRRGSLRERGRRHPTLRRLLERIRQLDQPRLAARRPRESDPERGGPRIEAGWEGRAGFVRHETEGHDDDGNAGAGSQPCAPGARREDRIELVLFEDRVDASRPTEQFVSPALAMMIAPASRRFVVRVAS